jgi:hypothetical protein
MCCCNYIVIARACHKGMVPGGRAVEQQQEQEQQQRQQQRQ